ncbi:MAG: RNA polymerase sigma factor RpoH [Gammaproteobacteria bacterium]|nr:MAG: RNA polymerase sigma factor RpoH [Gammaproteobacteria bacterium]
MAGTALIARNQSTLPAIVAGSEEAYQLQIREIPILSAEEEHELACKFYYEQDLEAARKLVMSHLRFVVHIAKGFMGYGLALNDLIQEGNIGLMKAVKRFNPELGVRLVSFAVHWIKSEIHDFVIKNWRIVKVATTKAQRKLFFNLRKAKKRLGWMNKEEVEAVANDLGVKPETVLEMESRLSGNDVAFDAPTTDDEEQTSYAPANFLEDHSTDPALLVESSEQTDNSLNGLASAMEGLDARSQDILKRRWLDENKATLHELAAEYNVSAERIRQLEKNAMKKLKTVIAA